MQKSFVTRVTFMSFQWELLKAAVFFLSFFGEGKGLKDDIALPHPFLAFLFLGCKRGEGKIST